jgi:hypothetical protein
MEQMQAIEELICATLRGERALWPARREDDFTAAFLVRSEYHGVQALLDQRLKVARGIDLGWPNAVLDACRKSAMIAAIWEMRHREILNRVLAGLSNIGVQPVLFKGSALAYNIYASPYLRSRSDTDLIVPEHARDEVNYVLQTLGFKSDFNLRGDLNSFQASYSLVDSVTYAHNLDLHWRISNSHVLAKLFSYEELASEARSLPTMGPDAKAAGTIDALLIACMHRAAHKQCPYFVDDVEHYGGDRLIWLHDIHLLLGEMQPRHCDEFLERAKRKGLEGVCLEGIELARACFNTLVPERVREGLSCLGQTGAASRYLSSSVMYQYYANLTAVEGAENKVRFLTQLLVPSERYMRCKYPDVKLNWLPWLYLRRVARGLFKRLHRTIKTKLPLWRA